MRFVLNSLLSILFFGLFSLTSCKRKPDLPKEAVSTQAAKVASPQKPSPTATPHNAQSTKDSSEEQKIEIPIPVGKEVEGIKIPHYNDNGKLGMLFEADTALRLDDSRIEMKNLKIAIYEDPKKYDVQMSHAIFNLDTKILKSDSQAIIRRDDFEIIGQNAEFNTKTRFSKMTGNVKMTLFNMELNEK